MPICPDCRRATVDYGPGTCPECGWKRADLGGFADFLGGADHASALFTGYRALYDRIASDDLDFSIQDQDRLDGEARHLLAGLGPVAGRTVGEIGAGKGTLLRLLLERGAELVVGIDLASAYLKRLDTTDDRLRLLLANAEKLPLRAELDVLIASDVLEHVLNPADFLGSCVEALRPGGRIVIKVPYRENLSQYRTHDGGCSYPMVHLRSFDRRLLRETLEDAGLRPEHVSYSGFYTGRLNRPLARFGPLRGAATRALCRLYGDDDGAGLEGVNGRLGLLLMRPVTITCVARRR